MDTNGIIRDELAADYRCTEQALHTLFSHGTRNLLNLLFALVCNLETTFSAFKTKKLDRFDTEKGFLKLEDIVLNTSTNDKDDLIIEIMIVMGKDEEVVNDDDHPVKEVFKNSDHGLMEAETSNWNTFLHER